MSDPTTGSPGLFVIYQFGTHAEFSEAILLGWVELNWVNLGRMGLGGDRVLLPTSRTQLLTTVANTTTASS